LSDDGVTFGERYIPSDSAGPNGFEGARKRTLPIENQIGGSPASLVSTLAKLARQQKAERSLKAEALEVIKRYEAGEVNSAYVTAELRIISNALEKQASLMPAYLSEYFAGFDPQKVGLVAARIRKEVSGAAKTGIAFDSNEERKARAARKKLDTILLPSQVPYVPGDLLTFAKIDLGLEETYAKKAVEEEGFLLGRHTGDVMENFERIVFEKGRPLVKNADLLRLVRFALVLHDIGKPRAIELGDRRLQHVLTARTAERVMRQLNFADQEVNFVLSLIGGDPLGQLLQREISLDQAYGQISEMASRAGMDVKDFFPILSQFYISDAYSYPKLRSLIFTETSDKRIQIRSPLFDELQRKIDQTGARMALKITARKVLSEEERLALVKARLEAPIQRGSNWLRVSARSVDAYDFHRNWEVKDEGLREFTFHGEQYVFPLNVFNKARAWFELQQEFERNGVFTFSRDQGKILIQDFLPFPSYARDPLMGEEAVGASHPDIQQGVETVGIGYMMPKELEIKLGFYDPQYDLKVPAGLETLPIHSHPHWTVYSEGPSPSDIVNAGDSANLIFGMKKQIFVIYDKTSESQTVHSSAARLAQQKSSRVK
jgi:hypothetical protein